MTNFLSHLADPSAASQPTRFPSSSPWFASRYDTSRLLTKTTERKFDLGNVFGPACKRIVHGGFQPRLNYSSHRITAETHNANGSLGRPRCSTPISPPTMPATAVPNAPQPGPALGGRSPEPFLLLNRRWTGSSRDESPIGWFRPPRDMSFDVNAAASSTLAAAAWARRQVRILAAQRVDQSRTASRSAPETERATGGKISPRPDRGTFRHGETASVVYKLSRRPACAGFQQTERDTTRPASTFSRSIWSRRPDPIRPNGRPAALSPGIWVAASAAPPSIRSPRSNADPVHPPTSSGVRWRLRGG